MKKERIYIPRFNGQKYVVFPTYNPVDDDQLKLWSKNENLRYDLAFNTSFLCQAQCDQLNELN